LNLVLGGGNKSARVNIHQVRFTLQSLGVLEDEYQKRGGNITCVFGRVIDETPKLMKHYDAKVCYASKEYAFEETEDEKKLSSLIHLILTGRQTLLKLSNLPFDLAQQPSSFSSFRKKMEKNLAISSILQSPPNINTFKIKNSPIPTLKELGFIDIAKDERSVVNFQGVETVAKDRLQEWIGEKDCIATYKKTEVV
jgi:deoxyribodipyrimidine photo-lyase